MTITRSKTKIEREAPGLKLLLDAIDMVEKDPHVLKFNYDTIDWEMPVPPAPKIGYIQHYDHSRNKWVFSKIYPTDKNGIPIRN